MMRIAIDARELSGHPTGVGRYVSELLAAWARLPAAGGHEFVLCANAPVETPRGAPPRCLVATASGRGTAWQQVALPRLLRATGANVLLAPGYTGPLPSRVPMVLAVHDVSFLAHPEWFGAREGFRLRHLTRLSARRAARIVTCSDFSKREIARHIPAVSHKVDVVYLGVSPAAAPEPLAEAAATRASAIGGRLALYAGSIFARRHIPELVDAFSLLAARRPDVRLEIVGENRSKPRIDVEALVARSPAAARIAGRSFVPDEQLRALYQRASAFVFLSDYEGFGLTPLEALASGLPIVVLDTEVSREIYGPAARYVERPEPVLIAAALEQVLFDATERARLLAAAPAVLARYSWDECARRTLQILLASAS